MLSRLFGFISLCCTVIKLKYDLYGLKFALSILKLHKPSLCEDSRCPLQIEPALPRLTLTDSLEVYPSPYLDIVAHCGI